MFKQIIKIKKSKYERIIDEVQKKNQQKTMDCNFMSMDWEMYRKKWETKSK